MNKRVIFRLSMPGRPPTSTWGQGKNYFVTRMLSVAEIERLKLPNYFVHHFGDGWAAGIHAEVVEPRTRLPKSDGFQAYDWMVDNLLRYGQTDKPKGAV